MDEKFCDYFDRWVKEFKEGNIREVTLDKYYCTSKALRKIAPALMMSELDRTAYQRILNVYGETHEKTTAHGWHISDLKIYNKPKALSEFGLTRPPQPWRYVEVSADEP